MDDFGNIIYVLIAVGWFLFNAYKKSQKNKPKRAPRERQQPEPAKEESKPWTESARSLEDLILEQLGENPAEMVSEPESVMAHRNEDKFLNTDLTHSHLAEDYKMGESEMKSHRVQRQVRKVKIDIEEEESLIDILLPNGFNLQQAVVLNAILERPYR